jgi:hypothetical protein
MRITAAGLLPLLLAGTSALAAPPAWRISEASGDVRILRAGASRIASRGGALAAGDGISTGVNGRAVIVRGEEFLIVAPSSRLRLPAAAASGGITADHRGSRQRRLHHQEEDDALFQRPDAVSSRRS